MQNISTMVKRHPFISAFIVALIAALIVGIIITTLISTGGLAAIPFLAVPLGAIASFLGVGSLAGAGVGASIAVGTACALGVLPVGTIIAESVVALAMAVGTRKLSLLSSVAPENEEAVKPGGGQPSTGSDEIPKKPRVLKFVLVGDAGVGKTKLAERFTRTTYEEEYKTTEGGGFEVKTIYAPSVRFQIFDTAGRELYNAVTLETISSEAAGGEADKIYLIFDLSKPESFKNITKNGGWFELCQSKVPNQSDPNKPNKYVLAGLKSDLPDHDALTAQAKKWAQEHNMVYEEASAKDDKNVTGLFVNAAQTCLSMSPQKASPSPQVM